MQSQCRDAVGLICLSPVQQGRAPDNSTERCLLYIFRSYLLPTQRGKKFRAESHVKITAQLGKAGIKLGYPARSGPEKSREWKNQGDLYMSLQVNGKVNVLRKMVSFLVSICIYMYTFLARCPQLAIMTRKLRGILKHRGWEKL